MKVLYVHKKCVQLYTLQEGKCFYCQLPFQYQNLTRDHFHPRHKGGKNQYNEVLSCGKCNSWKGHKTLDEFIEFTEKGLNSYLADLKEKNIQVRPKSGEQMKIDKFRAIIERCTYLLENSDAISDVIDNYKKINYDQALDELCKKNKLIPYIMPEKNLNKK